MPRAPLSITHSACTASNLAPGAGEPARERLLLAALRLFAQYGYAKTSIRQVTTAADVNIASVSYYFGSKAGLYRAVFFGEHASAGVAFDAPALSLDDIFGRILAPLRNGTQARWWMQLHRREMLEPSGLWQEKFDRGMQPMHDALVALLRDRLGLSRSDDEVEALALVVIAPAVHLLVNCEVVDRLAPQLLAGPDAVERWSQRLLRTAEALIVAEQRRRKTMATPATGRASAPAPIDAPPKKLRSKA